MPANNNRRENKKPTALVPIGSIKYNDALMFRAALDVASSFASAESDPTAAGGLAAQHSAARGVSLEILEVLKDKVSPDKQDKMNDLMTIARMARAATEYEEVKAAQPEAKNPVPTRQKLVSKQVPEKAKDVRPKKSTVLVVARKAR